jgi:hypothetical protein
MVGEDGIGVGFVVEIGATKLVGEGCGSVNLVTTSVGIVVGVVSKVPHRLEPHEERSAPVSNINIATFCLTESIGQIIPHLSPHKLCSDLFFWNTIFQGKTMVVTLISVETCKSYR